MYYFCNQERIVSQVMKKKGKKDKQKPQEVRDLKDC